jgi:lysophospholipase L1-like esterase
MRFPKPLRRVLAVLAGGLIALFLGEIALRIHNPINLRLRGTTLVLPTNRRYVFQNPNATKLDPVVEVVRNDLGFRGPPQPADFEKHLTIVTIGGSTTECLHLAEDKTWPAVLSRALDEKFDDVWLNNAGLDGHSTFGHIQLVRQLILPLRPDYVLFMVGINDIDRPDLNQYDQGMLTEYQSFQQKLISGSELLSTVQAIWRTSRVQDLGLGHEFELNVETAKAGKDDPTIAAKYITDQRDRLAVHYAERLRLLVHDTRAAGIEPVFITQTCLFVDATDVATGRPIGPLKFGGWTAATRGKAVEVYNETTRAVASELGVHLIDLARKVPPDSRLFYDWMHFTNAGAAFVGDAIAQDLVPFLAERNKETHRAQ